MPCRRASSEAILTPTLDVTSGIPGMKSIGLLRRNQNLITIRRIGFRVYRV